MSDSNTRLPATDRFVDRHIGPSAADQRRMLASMGLASLEQLISETLPSELLDERLLALPPAATEAEAARELRELAAQNRVLEPMFGLGYHGTLTPAVIRRNLLENPGWYTAYTPYQPEISQGRLEALLNFQTMISELSALPVANASLLDEATAVAEAVSLMRRAGGSDSTTLLIDADCHPQTLAVVANRCRAVGLTVKTWDSAGPIPDGEFFGVVVQHPGSSGALRDHRLLSREVKSRGAMLTVVTDPLAMVLLSPPGEWGADVAVGSTQRFGVPIGFGGPHAAFMAVRASLERFLPGRLVGVAIDAEGRLAYRLALQTREQHIRREKATSNICTSQALLAVVASMYAVYHGAAGLRQIAERAHAAARLLAESIAAAGHPLVNGTFFDTIAVRVPGQAVKLQEAAADAGILIRVVDPDTVAISTSESTSERHVSSLLEVFGAVESGAATMEGIPAVLRRRGPALTHGIFGRHSSEAAMTRYLRRLADRDLALDRGMIPLGSCTMKLNSTAEMESLSLDGFSAAHPFAPAEMVAGSLRMIEQLETWLAELTGYAKVSVQPNAGSQGELAGLLAIRAYHAAGGMSGRDVCLIPSSAHGTNAASAVLAGMRVVVVKSTADGAIDLDDLRANCVRHSAALAAIMVTYPSTSGVYENTIHEVCDLVHQHGGQVYIDGANLNALVGAASPGRFGGDVSHLNLHKTFCVPHGGGGPGVGPVAVADHLVPYLPSHPAHPDPARRGGIGPVAAAPFGSAWILGISWAYIRMMSGDGLRRATAVAVLSANYVARRLADHYPILFASAQGRVAHECVLDLRPLTKATGVTVDDVAKRLADHGFHAPTVSFPVAGTLMVEPTESEDLAELDRFCDAMISIRQEISQIAEGVVDVAESPLRRAPHTAAAVMGVWNRPYDRLVGAFPGGDETAKYWPPVARIDQSYGDRNLVCTCPPLDAYVGEAEA